MKIRSGIILAAFFAFLLSSCNQGEGLGGSSSIEGYVRNIVYQDDSFVFKTDTFPAAGKKVYLRFGDDEQPGKDVDAGTNGYFRFDYLREGNYTVYALSETASGEKIPVYQQVRVNSKKVKTDTIYIRNGKAYGTAMIRGYVTAYYFHKGDFLETAPATNVRAFIRNAEDVDPKVYFDDVRVANGYFIFQKLKPGEYVVAVASESIDEIVDVQEESEIIKITDTEKIYDVEKELIVCVVV